MKFYKALIITLAVSYLLTSCFEDNDDNIIQASEINDFVWKGMNTFYLYKENVSNLANDRFTSDAEYADYLNDFSSPEQLFESLIYERQTFDRFSWITDNYFENEALLNGRTLTNGMQFTIMRRSDTDPVRYGIVLYVLPGSSADIQGLKRGDIFYAVNGSDLYYNSPSDNNYSLFDSVTYSIDLGTYNTNGTPELDDDSVTSLGESVSLTKEDFTENPIHVNKVLDVGGKKIGYLMYTGFNGSSSELNNVFATFKSAGVTELVLDLRYNSGGFNSKAILMSSLITGQFTGDVLIKKYFNNELQTIFEDQDPDFLIDKFINNEDGMSLNSLNLNKVYALTTVWSASASELVINCLKPYIDVIQIGTNTSGKYQGSFTLYDSPDFTKDGVNPNHTYAIQPLIFKYANIDDKTDFFDGLEPDIFLGETRTNLGILGDENEPLLAEAIGNITGTGKFINQKGQNTIESDNLEPINSIKGKLIDDRKIPKHITNRLIFE
ncbi:S41 family peptidase [Seonamhaeicola maritimus]|uniref:Carboxyl-terminal protease n=1 Tax=Seonamhaeicola maritimus TaxID=2591822 RepID=A0A5C7GMP2_9FLAO|nr:S41 family peptidase [Seonamhaeicola maritimus]TXG39347.1 carboxyl-terminal protease [Seonamhaeicola maritimus]